MNDLFDQIEDDLAALIEDERSIPSPDCGLYIVLPNTQDHEKQAFQLGQALHAANRFSTYAINRHVVEYRPVKGEAISDIAKTYRDVCSRNGFIFLVHDDYSLARDIEADGVVCSSLKNCSEARKILDEDKIIGLRTSSKTAGQSALSLELDFVCFYAEKDGSALLDLLNWWTTATETPVAIEGNFDQESCAPYVAGGATFVEASHHIWGHPSGNPMQGVVNMLDGFERHANGKRPSLN